MGDSTGSAWLLEYSTRSGIPKVYAASDATTGRLRLVMWGIGKRITRWTPRAIWS
jgi:hypothetical protein